MMNWINLCTDAKYVPGVVENVTQETTLTLHYDEETDSWIEDLVEGPEIVERWGGLPTVGDDCCQIDYDLYGSHRHIDFCGKGTYKITSGCEPIEDFALHCGKNVQATFSGAFDFHADITLEVQDRDPLAKYLRLHTSEDCSGEFLTAISPSDILFMNDVSHYNDNDQMRSIYLPADTVAELVPTILHRYTFSRYRKQDGSSVCITVADLDFIPMDIGITYLDDVAENYPWLDEAPWFMFLP